MEKILVLNPEQSSEIEMQAYPLREAARAVVLDEQNNVALLFTSLKNYYKLPGGGLEGGEEIVDALKRECKEELGCEIEVREEIGTVVEYRKTFSLKQVSYCYLVQAKGKKGVSEFTESELEDGFEVVWLPYEEALRAISKNITADAEGKLYIVPRDVAILKAATRFLPL